MVKTDWWRDFFSGVAVDLWQNCTTAEMTRAEADFLKDVLHLPPGAAVLDVPCGNGRHALELASLGCRVTGVDLSSDFLKTAREQAAARGSSARFEQREMRDLPWEQEFDAAYCCGNSFGYLEHEGNVQFLNAVARALKPGGRFCLNTGTVAESILPRFEERKWYEIGEILFLIHNQYDASASRLITEYTFIRDGKVDRRTGSQQVYTLAEVYRLLEQAGFADFQPYSSLKREPYQFRSPELLLVAVKKV